MESKIQYLDIVENQNEFVSVFNKAMIFMYLTCNKKKKKAKYIVQS